MTVEYCIISIGALSHNRLWGETRAVRTAHATTTLVSDAKRLILVDPSLPESALAARFNERTGKTLADVTDVFCTTLRSVHRRGIKALRHATWWCSRQELQSCQHYLQGILDSAHPWSAEEKADMQADLDLLDRFRPAPERFTPQVHFYPLVGASAGSAGLLLAPATSTIVIAGDAVVTGEHLARGQVWEGCADTQAAMESLSDLLEVAVVIVPGHDNLTLSPRHWL